MLNALGYRIRPYEVEAGATDRALEQRKKIVYDALDEQTNVAPVALCKARREFSARSKVDRTIAEAEGRRSSASSGR